MATNVSDRNGRALEYKLVDTLSTKPGFSLTAQAIAHNSRDFPKFQALPANLKTAYTSASNTITNWVIQNINSNSPAEVDRLIDDPNSVADVVVSTGKITLELSLKHNHQALKHPRPYSFAQFCGYSTGSVEDLQHRKLMEAVVTNFRSSVGSVGLFNQCKGTDIDNLYFGVCNSCATSLNGWAKSNTAVASNLFKFLVSTGYYKVIVETRSGVVVKVQDYFSIPTPSAVACSVSGNRFILTFNNGWVINLRIHTASSRISAKGNQLSLKFDAQRTQGLIAETII
jgi:hypothetical protein